MAECKKLKKETICFWCKVFQIILSENNFSHSNKFVSHESISRRMVAIEIIGQVTFISKKNKNIFLEIRNSAKPTLPL